MFHFGGSSPHRVEHPSPVLPGIPKISFKKGPRIEGFELLDLEELVSRPWERQFHDPFKPHRVDFFAVFLMEGGQAKHWVDFETRHLSPGDTLIVSKNQVQAFDAEGDYQGHLVLFTEEFLLKYLAASTTHKISRLYNYHLSASTYHSPDENGKLIRSLKEELANEQDFVLANVVAAVLSIYLLKLEARNQNQDATYAFDHKYELFERFKALLETDYALTRNARDFAINLGISYKHLNEVCKQFTFSTAKNFVDDHVILESKRLLASSPLSIKEICFKCGFDEPTNFLKYFKKNVGKTPSEFRNTFL